MVEAFWSAMQFVIRVGFTAFCMAATIWMWQHTDVSSLSSDMWVVFGGIHGMLIAFVIMVWRYEG